MAHVGVPCVPCESYFVESHDGCGRQARNEKLEEMRRKQLYMQGAMATELSQQTRDEYLDEILSHMEKMEVRSLDRLVC